MLLSETNNGIKNAMVQERVSLESKLCDLEDLKETVSKLPESLLKHLVSHRGFHSVEDKLTRPLENTLAAYEQAWFSGIPFCECDIALTTDGQLVLSHDDNLSRVAANPKSPQAQTNVRDLSWPEVSRIMLKNGTHAPLLETVLDACTRYEHAQLVIELKYSFVPNKVAEALVNLLLSRPDFMAKTAVIMSFDLHVVAAVTSCLKARVTSPTLTLPKVMILTNARGMRQILDDGTHAFSLTEDESLDTINSLINYPEVPLDGIYMQYQSDMLTDPVVSGRMRKLCERYTVGVWGGRLDPDKVLIGSALVELGVDFVNTDLPRSLDYLKTA